MEDIIVVFADIDTPQEENEEFIELIKACDMNIVTCFKQPLKAINFRTFIGKGKCLEIQTYLTSTKVDTIIFNQELSPLQIRNLEEIFQIPVLDRTDLIPVSYSHLDVYKRQGLLCQLFAFLDSSSCLHLIHRTGGNDA